MSEEKKGGGRSPPPPEHQFKKGVSGNPRGRPPKEERAISELQMRRDILNVAQRPTTISTGKGERKIPLIEAVVLRAAQKALAGHMPSIRFFFSAYQEATREHVRATPKEQALLALYEEDDRTIPPLPATMRRTINAYRKRTRKL